MSTGIGCQSHCVLIRIYNSLHVLIKFLYSQKYDEISKHFLAILSTGPPQLIFASQGGHTSCMLPCRRCHGCFLFCKIQARLGLTGPCQRWWFWSNFITLQRFSHTSVAFAEYLNFTTRVEPPVKSKYVPLYLTYLHPRRGESYVNLKCYSGAPMW